MQVKEGDWVLYRIAWPCFGRVAWVRGDAVLVDQVEPGTCYANERTRLDLTKLDQIVAVETERHAVESGWRAIRAAMRPSPTSEALTQVGLKAIKNSKATMASVRADLEQRRCRASVAGSGS